MRTIVLTNAFTLLFVASFLSPCFAQDIEGSKDHPLFNRMPGFYITEYKVDEFAAEYFLNEHGSEVEVKGKKTYIRYETKTPTSEYKIIENYTNAIKKIGGKAYEYTNHSSYLSLIQGGKETWVAVYSSDIYYCLTIVEKGEVEQVIVADPKALANDINATGHVAVYGIYFDVDSYAIKPESEPTLQAISEMLKSNSTLNVMVVGHTDMTGELEYNMDLSNKRAKAVVDALVNKYGISASRLKGMGAGPLSPVSTNKTEDGRKLNRRVELVEW